MKYKLINNKTKEEHLCDKVTVDGFEYYVNDETIKEDYWYLCWSIINNINSNHQIRKANNIEPVNMYSWASNYKKVIATNNPNIDIPKVVDEVEQLSKVLTSGIFDKHDILFCKSAIRVGYNKSQETHPFSEEDFIDFLRFVKTTADLSFYSTGENVGKPHKKLIKLWKEQQIKTLYYE